MSSNHRAMHAIYHTFSDPTYQRIREHDARRSQAAARLCHAISMAWPIGLEVEAYLSKSQVTPSLGTVVFHHTDGTIGVKLSKPNSRGYHTVKNIHYSNMATMPRSAAVAQADGKEARP